MRYRVQIATWSAVGLSLAMTLPGLNDGLVLDDHVHALFVTMLRASGSHRFWALFDVWGRGGPSEISTSIGLGTLPWWTHPNLSMAFFRPLAALTHYADYALFPGHPWWMHLQNSVWYALLVWLVSVLYRRIGGASPKAALAALGFAVSEAHAHCVAWISGRNTVMTAVAVAAVLVAYDRRCRDDWRAARWVAPLALLAGHASSEGAISVWAYLVPYAIFLDRGSARERCLRLAPLALVSIAWQILYRLGGYGVYGSGAYRDPFLSPRVFFTQQVPRDLPLALRELLFPSPVWGGLPGDPMKPAVAWCTVVVVVACIVLMIRGALRERRTAYWLCALLLSLFPLCIVEPSPRFFLIPDIAVFALLAELAVDLWRAALEGGRRGYRALAAALVFVLAMVHGVAPLWLAPHAHHALVQAEYAVKLSAATLPPFARAAFDEFYVVNTPHFFVTALSQLYEPTIWPRTYILGATTKKVHVSRPDATSIVLTAEGGYLSDRESQFVRAPEYAFTRGQVVAMGPMQVTVEDTTPDGRPLRVRFRAESLVRPRTVWITWAGMFYVPFPLPSVGGSFDLPG